MDGKSRSMQENFINLGHRPHGGQPGVTPGFRGGKNLALFLVKNLSNG
jgi:hypothetical protein